MGDVVARGKIKVDARKALHKLRDHMLVDLHLWATEIARVAVTIGATHLDVEWDADDVILSFDGRALAPAAIASVRDHVLGGDAATEENDALRVLGIGVTAALGLAPAFVDVYSGDARVRFDVKYIDDETSPLPAPERVKRDDQGALPMRVHVRKKLGLDVLGRAVSREIPREIALLVEAAADAPLVLRGRGLPKRVQPVDVVMRVDLDVPEAMRAVLEVLRPVRGYHAERAYLERGIRLAAYAGVEAWGLREGDLPLRVLVDARRLPTNASRSELRSDSDLVRRVKERTPRALEVALEGLRDPSKAKGTKIGHAIEIVDARPEVLRDALGALAASIALESRTRADLPEAARALLDLPLMQDAIGAPLTLARVVEAMRSPPVNVFRGDAAEDSMLAPWLSGIPWMRGETVERLLEAEPTMNANAIVAEARAGGARRARALAHPPSRPVLARTPSQILVESFTVTEGRFAGLEGEVAVTKRDGAFRRAANVHVFVEERVIEVIPLPGTGLPVDIALAWPAQFRPRKAYDGIERTSAIEEAVHYALRVAAMAIGERLGRRDPELARLAIIGWLDATSHLRDVTPSIAALGKLASEPAWRTSEPDRHVSLVELEAYAKRTGALCIARAGTGRAADGRPVLDEEHVTTLRPLLPDRLVFVPYARALAVGAGEPLDWIGREAASMVAHVQITRPHVAGIVGIDPRRATAVHRTYHRGFVLRDAPRPLGASIIVEDLAAVPDAKLTGAMHLTALEDTTREERALLEIVVERCERGDLDPLLVERYLGDAAEELAASDGALHARIVDIPKKAARARAAARRAELLARPPSAPVIPPGPSGTLTQMGVGSATVVVPGVAVLDTWTPPDTVVLHAGRELTKIPARFPAVAFVEVTREEYVGDDWASLSEKGLTWANDAVASAAAEAVKNNAARAETANDVALLRLAAALLDEGPPVSSRIDHAVRKIKWPTVQGGMWSLGDGGERAVRHHGQRAYASWIREDADSSLFDEPAPCLPPSLAGGLRARILRVMGCEMTDATEVFARLQEQRARRAKFPPPKLAGAPLHPRMRGALSALGATCVDGEIEVVEAAGPDVVRIDATGAATPFAVSTSLPVRASFRCDDADVVRAAGELADAAERLVRRLATNLRDLPPAARAAVRVLVCSKVARSEPLGDLERLALFPDVTGKQELSLEDLRKAEITRVVTDPPPYPTLDPGAPAIFLWTSEKTALENVARFQDITGPVRRILQGERRRAAPPIARAALDDDLRRACLLVIEVDDGSLVGEVGVLAPAHASLRGIHVHHRMRPLVTLPDVDGWPLVAIVNDDQAHPTRAFDDLASREDVARIRAALRAAATARAGDLFDPAPKDAIAVIRLPFPFYARPDRTPCLALLWVEREWPERPEVHVEAMGHVDPLHVPRSSKGGLSDIVPVRGKVLVAGGPAQRDAALREVFWHAQKRLGSVLASAARTSNPPSAETLAAYAWDLRLLGERTDCDPTSALAADRPDEILLRVVARRAPHLLKLEATPAPEPEITVQENADPPPESVVEAPSFFDGLVRRIVELVSGPEPKKDPAFTNALAEAIVAMKLTGNPVTRVKEARRGRPVRFDVATNQLVVNTQHAAVRALAAHPSRLLFLLAAAVSEVNRELEQVTDAEEMNVILDLLRG